MATLVKHAGESRTYVMDFSLLPELVSGDMLSSIVSVVATAQTAGAAALTVGATAIAGKTVTALLSGGADNVAYAVVFTVLTAGGSTLVGSGTLLVDDF